jgi:hypothetical protein
VPPTPRHRADHPRHRADHPRHRADHRTSRAQNSSDAVPTTRGRAVRTRAMQSHSPVKLAHPRQPVPIGRARHAPPPRGMPPAREACPSTVVRGMPTTPRGRAGCSCEMAPCPVPDVCPRPGQGGKAVPSTHVWRCRPFETGISRLRHGRDMAIPRPDDDRARWRRFANVDVTVALMVAITSASPAGVGRDSGLVAESRRSPAFPSPRS